MTNKKTLFMYGVIALMLMITGTYTNIINYASAVPTVVSMAYGVTCNDSEVAIKNNNLNSGKAWFACTSSAGVSYIIVKSATTDTVIAQIPLGSTHTSVKAIAYIDDYAVVVVSSNIGYAIIDEPTNTLLRNVTSTTFDDLLEFHYVTETNILYGLTASGYIKINYDDGALELEEISTNVFSECNASCDAMTIDRTSSFAFIAHSEGTAADSVLRIDLDTDTNDLELVLGGATTQPFDVAVDTVNDFVYVSLASSAAVRKYTQDFTTLSATITVSTTPRKIAFDSVNDKLYVVADSDDTVRIFDGTTNAQIGSGLTICTSPVLNIEVKPNISETIVFVPCVGTSARIIHSDLIVEGAIDDIVCLDVNFDGVVDVCYEDINGDGIADASPLEIIRGGQNVTESANNIACQIGIETACDNPDPKTNGVGFLLVIVLLAFMIVLFAMARLHTNLIVPEWLWIIGTFTVLGASIFLGWIDTTLFIIGVIVIIAMASFKIVAQFVGSDF